MEQMMKKYFLPILAVFLAGCQQTASNNDQLMTTNELLGEWQCVGNNMETDRTVEIYHFKENGAFEYEGEVNRLDILVYGIQAKGIWTLANNKLTVISQSGNVEKRHPKKVLAELRKNKTLSNRENALSETLAKSLNSQMP